jgi:hypothetical protein
MKKYVFILFLLLVSQYSILAQPNNDLCINAFEISAIPFCTELQFSNLNATPDFIGENNNPECFKSNPPSGDVWFSFIPDHESNELTISILGSSLNNSPIKNIQAAVYRGSCGIDGMIERDCAVSDEGSTGLIFNIRDLTAGEKYYLRIDNFYGPVNSGNFTLCIKKKDIFNIKNENFSDLCTGVLFDSGGESGDFQNNENYIFTICPENKPGSNLKKSVKLEFEYYYLPSINKIGDTLNFTTKKEGDLIRVFNGQDTSYSQVLVISGNEKYKNIEGYNFGGGVGLTFCSESPCITIQFISDDSISGLGFKMKWTCSDQTCADESNFDLIIKNDTSEETLLKGFVNKGVEAKVAKITCDKKAYGIYDNFSEDGLLEKGLVMTNGLAQYIKGPNKFSSRSYVLNNPGDPDLDSLSFINNKTNWQRSVDACVIEMDVIPFGEEISYKYLFGSEEYPEYSNSLYNDIFALFISGKDIVGESSLRGQVNMAKIPGTDKDVEINSVNYIKNWQYYHSNINGKHLEYDGFVWDSLGKKKYLTAKQAVVPCETYHLKFAIADRGDTIYDSGVLISGLSDGRPELYAEIYNSDFLADNCSLIEGKVFVSTNSSVNTKEEYQVEISGTAINGADYLLEMPSKIIFEPGEKSKVYNIKVIEDLIEEGTETIIISIYKDLPCGRKLIDTEVIQIKDKTTLEIDVIGDTITTCKNNVLRLKSSGNDFVSWEPKELFEEPENMETLFYPDTSRWIYMFSRLFDAIPGKCSGIDSVYINVRNPNFQIEGDSVIEVCNNTQVKFTISGVIGSGKLEWIYKNRVIKDTKDIIIEATDSDFMVYAIYSEGDCLYYDSVYVKVISYSEPEILIEKEIIYYGDTIMISAFPKPDFVSGDSLKWVINGMVIENNDLIDYKVDSDTISIYLALNYKGYCPGDTFLQIKTVLRELIFPEAVIYNVEGSDHFRVYNLYSGLEICDFSIFNQWGERVFNCKDIECVLLGWDGSFRGAKCTPGVYIYNCLYKDPFGQQHNVTGSFLLLE